VCVKLYRPTFCEFGAEWIELCISEALLDAKSCMAPFVSAENVFRKTFSAFAGVCCNVKQSQTENIFL
jgi:hypothetical protein